MEVAAIKPKLPPPNMDSDSQSWLVFVVSAGSFLAIVKHRQTDKYGALIQGTALSIASAAFKLCVYNIKRVIVAKISLSQILLFHHTSE